MRTASVTVPYFDLKAQYGLLRAEILEALDRVCQNAGFILGEEVERFEQVFAKYCEVKHCVALNSGTSALHLALLSAGIGAGDEVITTSNTFIATAEAIAYTGATPVFVDVEPATANIDPAAIQSAITKRTRAIIPVHLYGRPCNMDAILEIAKRHLLLVIEDACQAHGARYAGTRVGGFGYAAAFSFYPGKNLGAYGEGGALTTNNDEVAALARSLRSHGESTRYLHKYVGYNYRMDGFQGAVLNVKMKYLEQWTAKRQSCAELYRRLLQGAKVRLPEDPAGAECVYHLFVAYVENRDQVRAGLEKLGVQTAVHYPKPVHLQEAFSNPERGPNQHLPFTERACEQVLSMPLFPEMTEEQVTYAAHCLSEVAGKE
ncbi:MAG TPA: DegT/DnrJ/EryC1/StrS family aminotransferase [Terriglobales bacterium]|nr:DegT/DnrJ/EryC1/StrS family aminotransferase [Terriglobales bacterium]